MDSETEEADQAQAAGQGERHENGAASATDAKRRRMAERENAMNPRRDARRASRACGRRRREARGEEEEGEEGEGEASTGTTAQRHAFVCLVA